MFVFATHMGKHSNAKVLLALLGVSAVGLLPPTLHNGQASAIDSTLDRTASPSALRQIQAEFGEMLVVERLDTLDAPALAKIPITWDAEPPKGPVAFKLSVIDTRAISAGEDLVPVAVAAGEIAPGAGSVELRLPPHVLDKHADFAWPNGSIRFQLAIVDSAVRGLYSFERWHPLSRSAELAVVGSARSDEQASSLRESAGAVAEMTDRWLGAPPASLITAEGAVSKESTDTGAPIDVGVSAPKGVLASAVAAEVDFLDIEEARFSNDGYLQGLVISSAALGVLPLGSGADEAAGDSEATSKESTEAEDVEAEGGARVLNGLATPPQCGSLPYLFSMYRYKNDITRRWLRHGSTKTLANTTVRAFLANSSRTQTQGVLEYAGQYGSASLSGYTSFTGSVEIEFDTVLNNQTRQFQTELRYNFYRNQCPDLSGNGLWYDLPEREYIPKQWTGGAHDAPISSLGWDCNANYAVSIGQSLRIGHNRTKVYSSGITATLLGITAGAKQTTENNSSWTIQYVKDANSNAKVCGQGNDPIYTANTQEYSGK